MSEDMSIDEPFHIEQEGAISGLNPMFGEWQKTFKFAPVPYRDGSERRKQFRQEMQEQMTNKWSYSHEVKVYITLYLDVQKVLETSETADLDNYAKAILDGLKGHSGIMFDDTQVQSLSVHWVDALTESCFTVETKSSPDDFVLKPTEFFEMPDGLWYPNGHYVWSKNGAKLLCERDFFAGLSILEMMSSVKNKARLELRKTGFPHRHAYYRSSYVSSLARGFHRSRLEDSGFTLHRRRDWQERRQRWKEDNPGDLEPIEKVISDAQQNYRSMIDLLAGNF